MTKRDFNEPFSKNHPNASNANKGFLHDSYQIRTGKPAKTSEIAVIKLINCRYTIEI